MQNENDEQSCSILTYFGISLQRYGKEDPETRDLFRDLQIQDELEMDLKRSIFDDQDPYGEHAAIVRRKLHS